MKLNLSNTPNNFLFGHMTDEPGLNGAFVKSYYDGVSRAAGFWLVPFLLLGSFLFPWPVRNGGRINVVVWQNIIFPSCISFLFTATARRSWLRHWDTTPPATEDRILKKVLSKVSWYCKQWNMNNTISRWQRGLLKGYFPSDSWWLFWWWPTSVGWRKSLGMKNPIYPYFHRPPQMNWFRVRLCPLFYEIPERDGNRHWCKRIFSD